MLTFHQVLCNALFTKSFISFSFMKVREPYYRNKKSQTLIFVSKDLHHLSTSIFLESFQYSESLHYIFPPILFVHKIPNLGLFFILYLNLISPRPVHRSIIIFFEFLNCLIPPIQPTLDFSMQQNFREPNLTIYSTYHLIF